MGDASRCRRITLRRHAIYAEKSVRVGPKLSKCFIIAPHVPQVHNKSTVQTSKRAQQSRNEFLPSRGRADGGRCLKERAEGVGAVVGSPLPRETLLVHPDVPAKRTQRPLLIIKQKWGQKVAGVPGRMMYENEQRAATSTAAHQARRHAALPQSLTCNHRVMNEEQLEEGRRKD